MIKDSLTTEEKKRLTKLLKEAGIKKTRKEVPDDSFKLFDKSDYVVLSLMILLLIVVIYKQYGIIPFNGLLNSFKRELNVLSNLINGR